MLLLSVWMWEHFSVGRPPLCQWLKWEDHGNPLRFPTWAYKWDVVGEFQGDPEREYICYTNKFDALTCEQVKTCMIFSLFMFLNLYFCHFNYIPVASILTL
jgi:hypothetical protein